MELTNENLHPRLSIHSHSGRHPKENNNGGSQDSFDHLTNTHVFASLHLKCITLC